MRQFKTLWVLCGLSALVLWSAACAPARPQLVVVAYGEAIEANNPELAYELLSPELKARVSYKDFKAAWEERRNGLMPITGELKAVETSAAKVRAELNYSDYDTLKMRLTNNGWRITSGVLDLYSQDTPRKTLVAFVRAMEDRRYESLMRFIPNKYAKHMSPELLKADFEKRADEIEEMITELKANLENPITHREDRASMAYGHRKVSFMLEDGLWKIEDPD